jgi:hypothetical protein
MSFPPIGFGPTEAQEQSVRLCAEAQVAIHCAREIRAESAQLRRECECWRQLWEVYRRGGYVVVRCAYCGRVRFESGDWSAIPTEVSRQLQQIPQGLLSHGVCEDCLRQHFPHRSIPV